MGKVLFWIVIVLGFMFVLRFINLSRARARRLNAQRQQDQKNEATAKKNNETMVQCCRCGVFVPRSEARLAHDGYHCGDARCDRYD